VIIIVGLLLASATVYIAAPAGPSHGVPFPVVSCKLLAVTALVDVAAG